MIRSYTNSGNVKALGAELNANLTAGKFARFFVGGSLYSIQIGFREIRRSYFYSQQSKKLRCNRLLQCFLMKLWVKRTSIKTEKLFGLSIYNFNTQGDVFGYKENNSSTNWSLKGNMNLLLRKDLKFTLDFDMRSATVTTQGRNEMFYMSNAALNYTPKALNGWDLSIKVLDILSSNVTGLNTRAYNPSGTQIFYQEVEYNRFGPIMEISASYSFNMNGKSRKIAESTFGEEQF